MYCVSCSYTEELTDFLHCDAE